MAVIMHLRAHASHLSISRWIIHGLQVQERLVLTFGSERILLNFTGPKVDRLSAISLALKSLASSRNSSNLRLPMLLGRGQSEG